MGVSLANIDVGGVLGGLGTFAKNIREAITGKSILDPNKQAELLAQAAQIEADLTKAQTEINKVEAASASMFVAGARPFIIWTCGFGFAWQYVIGPFFQWISTLVGHPTPIPILDSATMQNLLFGLLGLGAMRTVEKVKNASGNH